MEGEQNPYFLKVKDAGEAIGHARSQVDSAGSDYREKRVAFFDRLALLNASALASSATVLGYFAPNHSVARAQLVLELGWGTLLLAMATALARNYLAPLPTWHESFEIYALKKAEHQQADADAMRNLAGTMLDRHTGQPLDRAEQIRIAEGNAAQWEEASKGAASKAKVYKVLLDVSEYTSLVASFAGVVLLVAFTVLNMAR